MLVDFHLRFEISGRDLLVLAGGAAVALLLRLRSREEEYSGLVGALQGRTDPRLDEAWRSAARLHSSVEEAERRFVTSIGTGHGVLCTLRSHIRTFTQVRILCLIVFALAAPVHLSIAASGSKQSCAL